VMDEAVRMRTIEDGLFIAEGVSGVRTFFRGLYRLLFLCCGSGHG